MTLFDPGPAAEPPPTEPVSPDRRRTIRNEAELARGRHPATGLLLLDGNFTCGQCGHCVQINGYYKCDVSRLGLSASASSDIRLKWPACTQFRPGD